MKTSLNSFSSILAVGATAVPFVALLSSSLSAGLLIEVILPAALSVALLSFLAYDYSRPARSFSPPLRSLRPLPVARAAICGVRRAACNAA